MANNFFGGGDFCSMMMMMMCMSCLFGNNNEKASTFPGAFGPGGGQNIPGGSGGQCGCSGCGQ